MNQEIPGFLLLGTRWNINKFVPITKKCDSQTVGQCSALADRQPQDV